MGDNDIYLSKEQADKLEKVITNNEIPEQFQVTSLTPEDFKKSESEEVKSEEKNINAIDITIIILIIFCVFALILKLLKLV